MEKRILLFTIKQIALTANIKSSLLSKHISKRDYTSNEFYRMGGNYQDFYFSLSGVKTLLNKYFMGDELRYRNVIEKLEKVLSDFQTNQEGSTAITGLEKIGAMKWLGEKDNIKKVSVPENVKEIKIDNNIEEIMKKIKEKNIALVQEKEELIKLVEIQKANELLIKEIEDIRKALSAS